MLTAPAEDHIRHAARHVFGVLHGGHGAEEPVLRERVVDPAGD
jgi:hypothetical protein